MSNCLCLFVNVCTPALFCVDRAVLFAIRHRRGYALGIQENGVYYQQKIQLTITFNPGQEIAMARNI